MDNEIDPEFGEWLNTVEKHARCPVHGVDMPMHVFEGGVRWACGHGRWLPPLRKVGRPSKYEEVPVRIVGRAA